MEYKGTINRSLFIPKGSTIRVVISEMSTIPDFVNVCVTNFNIHDEPGIKLGQTEGYTLVVMKEEGSRDYSECSSPSAITCVDLNCPFNKK